MIYVILRDKKNGKAFCCSNQGLPRFTTKGEAERKLSELIEKYPEATVHAFKNMSEAAAYAATFRKE